MENNISYNSSISQEQSDIFLIETENYWDLLTPSSGYTENKRLKYPIVSLSSKEIYIREKFAKEYITQIISFSGKLIDASKSFFKELNPTLVFVKVNEVLGSLIALEPSSLTTDLTEDRSVFFKTSINGYNIYLELFFFTTSETLDSEAILNIYKDKLNIYAFGGEVFECIEKIKQEVILSHQTYLYENELSDTPYSKQIL